jgi:hypothetical protein
MIKNNRFQVKGEKLLAIDNIFFFRENILPEWEDQVNRMGCEFQQGFITTDIKLLDNLWQQLLTRLVTAEFPHSEMVFFIYHRSLESE